jgi:pimeloyl-ACP methyl ester carboxylesterase
MTVDAIYRTPESAAALRRHYKELLAGWPVPHTEDWVPAHLGDTFVVASGHAEAPPVILLHGSGANSAMWREDAATWSTTMRVYAVDIPGEPGLSVAARPPLDSDAYVRWLTEVLDGLSVDRASLVGISLGGWLATQVAIRRADRVNRLVLLSPSGIGRQKTGTLLVALALLPFGRRGRELAMRKVLGAQLSGTAAGEYVLLIHEHFRPRTERVPIFTDIELTQIAAPTLVVVGQNDALLNSVETKQRLEQHAPHATVILIPDAGHLLPTQTDRVHAFLTDTTS